MLYARHQVELARKGPDGTAQREHWKFAAEHGNEDARRKLQCPEFPEHLAHVWEWARDLHGRSGVGMTGLAPLSYQEIEAWQRLHGIALTSLEVDALIAVDAALMGAAPSEDGASEPAEPEPVRAWPTRKPGVTPVFAKDA